MPVPLIATLDIDENTPANTYNQFIGLILRYVAQLDRTIDTSRTPGQRTPTQLLRMRHAHREDEAASVFRVRVSVRGEAMVDFFIQDTNLYGWGFTLPDQMTLYHLGSLDRLPAGVRALRQQNYTLESIDMGVSYEGDNGIPRGDLGWANLATAVTQLAERPDVTDFQRPAMGFLIEMICEAARFRRIAEILRGLWNTGTGITTKEQRREISNLEPDWDSISSLFIRYIETPAQPPPTTTLTRRFPDYITIALALTILHLRPGGAPGPSRQGSGAVRPARTAADTSPVLPSRFYPVLDAAGNQPGKPDKAWFFRPGTCNTYNLSNNAVDDGGHAPFADIWPGLENTDFGLRVDAVVPCPGTSSTVWLFSGHQYATYDTSGHSHTVGEIRDGWPALAGTAFADSIDAAVRDPRNDRYLLLFRDSEAISYDLDSNTGLWGPGPLTDLMPGLAGTSFAYGVSGAVTAHGGTGRLWLFRGDDCVLYNMMTNSVEKGPQRIHEGFTRMRGQAFVGGVAAVMPCEYGNASQDLWFFHDDLYLRYSLKASTGPRVAVGGTPIASAWKGLARWGFAARIDAALVAPWQFGAPLMGWFFQDNCYVLYNIDKDEVAIGPRLIGDGWTGLAGTGFENGIDAILQHPNDHNTVWIFAGDQYVRYQLAEDKRISGPRPISGNWNGLNNTVFSQRIDAACLAPGTDDEAWLFHGDSYVRYSIPQDRIVSGPASINDYWHLSDPGYNPFPDDTVHPLPSPRPPGI
ncbi:hemopexin repeat-containing protein [Streptomyces sp. NPDC004610]|uniref:hemopexin repeat-containing protein n=1 Tax=unclassified Streptomyces TaxID=2593676 RepID=UPI0033AF0C42